MKKNLALALLFIFLFTACIGCKKTPQGETHVEWVQSQYVDESTSDPISPIRTFDRILYYYHYYGDTIKEEEEYPWGSNVLAIELLDYDGDISHVGFIGYHESNGSNSRKLTKGTVIAFYVYYLDIQEAHISIKFYDQEIYNGTVYSVKERHNEMHGLEKDDN